MAINSEKYSTEKQWGLSTFKFQKYFLKMGENPYGHSDNGCTMGLIKFISISVQVLILLLSGPTELHPYPMHGQPPYFKPKLMYGFSALHLKLIICTCWSFVVKKVFVHISPLCMTLLCYFLYLYFDEKKNFHFMFK